MTTYQDLDWKSLDFVRHHLHRRLATLLSHARGHLMVAQSLAGTQDVQTQCRRASQGLELAMNTLKTWSALIQVKSGSALKTEQRRVITPTVLPDWLVETLNAQTAFKAEQTLPLFVQPDVFFESLILITEIAARMGHLKLLLLGDAKGETPGVWLRAIFDPPQSGSFAGLRGMVDRLDANNPAELDVLIQLLVLESLCQINGSCLKVQTNVDTGEQALAAQFVAASAEVVPCAELSELQHAADWEFTSATPPETLMVPPPNRRERIESMPVLEPPAAADEILPDTLIVPPPGLRERLAAIAENASETLMVPPLDFRQRLDEVLDAEPPDTLMVPPPDRHDRIAALDAEPPDTLMVPPPDLHDQLAAQGTMYDHLSATLAAEEPPETLMVPPPGLHELIDAQAQETAPDDPEHGRATASETAFAPRKSAEVEIVSAENGSDQVITPPPELHRRWLARKLAGDAPKDDIPPGRNGG